MMAQPHCGKIHWIGVSLAAALLVQASAGCRAKEEPPRLAPNFKLIDLYDRTVTLTQVRGKIVLLSFWATWAAPCRMGLEHFSWLKWKFGGDDFTVLGITVGESEKHVKRFIEGTRVNYTILIGDRPVVAAYLGMNDIKLPYSVLVDEHGYVVQRFTGYHTSKDFRPAVEAAIARLREDRNKNN